MSSPLGQLRDALAPQYEVKRELGTGGMDSVFLARDTLSIAMSPSKSCVPIRTAPKQEWRTWTRTRVGQRSRLSERDRAYLIGWTGPNYPAPSSAAELLGPRERALGAAPDRPETWYLLGDHFFHWGQVLGLDAAQEQFGGAVHG